MSDSRHFVIALEWSETPYHQGVYQVHLCFHDESGRWTLQANRNPSGGRLSWRKGSGKEDPRQIAIELLRKSYERGALTFDVIADVGPFEISMGDLVPDEKRLVESDQPITSPAKTCDYCRHMRLPGGFAAGMGRLFVCDKGQWTDDIREAARSSNTGIGSRKFTHTCAEFASKFR